MSSSMADQIHPRAWKRPRFVKVLDLRIPGVPMAVQSVRGGKHGFFQPAKQVNWKAYVGACAAQQLPDAWQLLDDALSVRFHFIFPPLKSFKKDVLERIKAGEVIYKPTRPDDTNLKKGCEDALTGIVWADDSLLCRSMMEKYYGINPEIAIEVFCVKE